MKNLLSISSILFLMALCSCEKVENKVFYEGGTAPVIAASTDNPQLEAETENDPAITFRWTNPNYRFTTGVSSQDVTYTLEFDTLGGNFTSKAKHSKVLSKELSYTFTGKELNAILGNSMLLQIDPRREYIIEARVISSIGNAVKLLSSNKVTFRARPFPPPPKINTPDAETLWIVGNATFCGWQNPLPSPFDADNKFTRVSRTLYELTINLPGGGNYKLIQTQGVWGTQYRILDGTWDGGTFEKRDADPGFEGPPSSGTYKMSFDFQLGRYSVVKQ
jgi:hypothetical protein